MPAFYQEEPIISRRDIGGVSSRSLLALAFVVCTLWVWEPTILALVMTR